MNILNYIYNKKEVPIWFMRQAGRYLPEYREIRKSKNSFLELCYDPKTASEITLQPIERFSFDAAIIFSDILVILDALGAKVSFKENIGPIIDTDINKFIEENPIDKVEEKINKHLKPVYEAIKITRDKLNKEKSLIGFAGGFWTLFAYLMEGKGSKDFNIAKRFYLDEKEKFKKLEEILTKAISIHLNNQKKAGCDTIKIFDSWAGLLADRQKNELLTAPTKKIIDSVKDKTTTIIYFPRNVSFYIEEIIKLDFDVLALDYSFPISRAKELHLKSKKIIQGNLDPIYLTIKNKEELKKEVEYILEQTKESRKTA